MVKFKILPKVKTVGIGDKTFHPGDIVELPESYRGETYLEEVKEPEPPKEALIKPAPSSKRTGPGRKK